MEMLVLVIFFQAVVIVYLLGQNKEITKSAADIAKQALLLPRANSAQDLVIASTLQKNAELEREMMKKANESVPATFSARDANPTAEFPNVYTTPDGKELKVLRPL